MTELKMYSDTMLNELRTSINDNLDSYNSGFKFAPTFIKDYDKRLCSLGIMVEYPKLLLKEDYDRDILQWEVDFNNSKILFDQFIDKYKIPLKYITDDRFISYLTHDIYYDFLYKRLKNDKSDKSVKEKYFISSSQAVTRNHMLRLLWYSYMTQNDNLDDKFELTKIAFEYADPVNQLMERKYSKNKRILHAALQAIKEYPNSDILKLKRTLFGKSINNILGTTALDVLPYAKLVEIFKNEIGLIAGNTINEGE